MFLIERIHALRAPYKRRFHDWLWIMNASLMVVGFGTIAILGFMWPLSDISPEDGQCRIGLPHYVTIPLLTFDVFLNIILTITFLYLLAPVARSNNFGIPGLRISHVTTWINTHCHGSRSQGVELRATNPHVAKRLDKLLLRTFVGSCLVLPPTIGNLTQLLIQRDRDLGFVCLLLCTCDGEWLTSNYFDTNDFEVTWNVCVFHWLSVSSELKAPLGLVPILRL